MIQKWKYILLAAYTLETDIAMMFGLGLYQTASGLRIWLTAMRVLEQEHILLQPLIKEIYILPAAQPPNLSLTETCGIPLTVQIGKIEQKINYFLRGNILSNI